MSASGLGRVKMFSRATDCRGCAEGVSDGDYVDQPLSSDDVNDPCQVVSQDGECHLSGDLRKGFGEEVRRSHAGFQRAERMLDCFSTLAHRFWVCVKALLYSLKQMLMLPASNSSLWPGCALRFQRTVLTSRGPVAPQHFAVFFVCIAIGQSRPSRAAIDVLLRQVDKVLLSEAAIPLCARRVWLGQRYRDAGFVAGKDLGTAKVAAIGHSFERLGF